MFQLSAIDVKKVVTNAVGTNIKVLNYSLEPFSANKEGVLGSHLLLKVSIENENNNVCDCEVKALTFFVKTLPESDLIQDIMDGTTFEEEVNFYKNIQPLMLSDYNVERYSPKCYLAENNVLVFEDLRVQGFIMNSNRIMGENYLKSSLAALARFHASTLLAEVKLGKPLNEGFPNFFPERFFEDSTKFGQGVVLGFKTIVFMAEKLDLDASFVLPHMYDYIHKSVRPQEGEFNVLCHTDLWKNNIMFNMFNDKVVPECVILDYQTLRYATPVGDLSMLLYMNTTPKFRRKFENEMVNHYYSIFQETLVQCQVKEKIPTHERMLQTYRKYRLIGMVMAAMYLPALYFEPEDLKNLINDPKAIERYMLYDRMEIIGPHLDTNPTYAKEMKDLLSEVLNEGKRVLNL